MREAFELLIKYWSYFEIGIKYTLGVAALSLIFGTILGTLIGVIRMSKSRILQILTGVYVEFVRGVPLLVQVYIFKYAPFTLFKLTLDNFQVAVIAVSLNSAAYVAEIIRSGISSLDKGQMEAGRSLGMSYSQTMVHVIMPQAIKNILPALGNEFVTLIKETSVVSTIGLTEITFQTNIVRSIGFSPLAPLIVSAFLYFVMTFTLSRIIVAFERRQAR